MSIDTLASWHRLIEERNADGLDSLLSEKVVFHSPILHTPQVGKALTKQYLAAALDILLNDSFRYVREVSNSRDAVLEFRVEVEGLIVNGVDMIRWDETGQIVEFKVMLRPLKAINLIHQKMAALFGESR
ncbi:MAG: nuclear transport factor 2 family protein [Lysobacterales bacterium]